MSEKNTLSNIGKVKENAYENFLLEKSGHLFVKGYKISNTFIINYRNMGLNAFEHHQSPDMMPIDMREVVKFENRLHISPNGGSEVAHYLEYTTNQSGNISITDLPDRIINNLSDDYPLYGETNENDENDGADIRMEEYTDTQAYIQRLGELEYSQEYSQQYEEYDEGRISTNRGDSFSSNMKYGGDNNAKLSRVEKSTNARNAKTNREYRDRQRENTNREIHEIFTADEYDYNEPVSQDEQNWLDYLNTQGHKQMRKSSFRRDRDAR